MTISSWHKSNFCSLPRDIEISIHLLIDIHNCRCVKLSVSLEIRECDRVILGIDGRICVCDTRTTEHKLLTPDDYNQRVFIETTPPRYYTPQTWDRTRSVIAYILCVGGCLNIYQWCTCYTSFCSRDDADGAAHRFTFRLSNARCHVTAITLPFVGST